MQLKNACNFCTVILYLSYLIYSLTSLIRLKMQLKYSIKSEIGKILLFTGICFLFYCADKETSHKEINKEIFIQVYCDIISSHEILPPSVKKTFSDSIFAHYQITEESFAQTIEAYQQQPEKWKKIFEEIIAELEKRTKLTVTLPVEN